MVVYMNFIEHETRFGCVNARSINSEGLEDKGGNINHQSQIVPPSLS